MPFAYTDDHQEYTQGQIGCDIRVDLPQRYRQHGVGSYTEDDYSTSILGFGVGERTLDWQQNSRSKPHHIGVGLASSLSVLGLVRRHLRNQELGPCCLQPIQNLHLVLCESQGIG